jgi:hypothetical protein
VAKNWPPAVKSGSGDQIGTIMHPVDEEWSERLASCGGCFAVAGINPFQLTVAVSEFPGSIVAFQGVQRQ